MSGKRKAAAYAVLTTALSFIVLTLSSGGVDAATWEAKYNAKLFNYAASEDGAGANTCHDLIDNGGETLMDARDPDCQLNTPGANADSEAIYDQLFPNANFAKVDTTHMSSAFWVAQDHDIPDGTRVGQIISFTTLSLLNAPCTSPITVTIPFMDGTTDIFHTADWKGSGTTLVMDDDIDGVVERDGHGRVDVNENGSIVTGGVEDDRNDVVLDLSPSGTDQVDIIDGLVDVNENGSIVTGGTEDDLNNVVLNLSPSGTDQVDIIDGLVDVNENGSIGIEDDLNDVVLNLFPSGTDQVDIIGDTDDNNDPGEDDNGVPTYADHYPSFLNDIFDPDGPAGATKPLAPRARYVGHQQVILDAPATQLEFVIFGPGDLAAGGMPAPESGIGDAYGYVNFVVLNNPTLTSPSTITGFCTGLNTTTTLTGKTTGRYIVTDGPEPIEVDRTAGQCTQVVSDPGPVASLIPDGGDDADSTGAPADGIPDDGCLFIPDPCVDVDYTGDTTVHAVQGEDPAPPTDNNSDTVVDERCFLLRAENPAPNSGIYGTGTHVARGFSQGNRDVDGDGVDNEDDICVLFAVNNTGVGGATDTDLDDIPDSTDPDDDNDGLGDACDPNRTTLSLGAPNADTVNQDVGFANDAWPAASGPAEAGLNCTGTALANTLPHKDDDGDTVINDGCGAAIDEDRVNNTDDDGDTRLDEDGGCRGTNGLADQDQDCYSNRNDNCPLVANDNFNLDEGVGAADAGFPADNIGDRCEPDYDGDTVVSLAECNYLEDDLNNVVLNLSPSGTDQVDIIDGRVDVNENGSIPPVFATEDDLNNVVLDLSPSGTDQVDIIDGRVDVNENGFIHTDDDLNNVVLSGPDQVDIIDGRVDVNENGPICTGTPANWVLSSPTGEATCTGSADDAPADGRVNDGCPSAGSRPEIGPECSNATNDDKDTKRTLGTGDDTADDALVNDGCPAYDGGQANGTAQSNTPIAYACIPDPNGSDDTDNDGDSDDDDDGVCDSTERLLGSDKDIRARTPEYIGLEYNGIMADNNGDTVLESAPGVCSDLTIYGGAGVVVDNDLVGGANAADAKCADIAGDTDDDGVLDTEDNCDSADNPEQIDGDNDNVGDDCDTDDDNDGTPDVSESYLGTDPKDGCADSTADDAWAYDFDGNKTANIIDVLFFGGAVGKAVTAAPYDLRRYDFDASATVNIIDVLFYGPYVGKDCWTLGSTHKVLTNSTGGAVDDIHVETTFEVTGFAATGGSVDSNARNWVKTAPASLPSYYVDLERADGFGDLANLGTLTLRMDGKRTPVSIRCYDWTLEGVIKNGSDRPCTIVNDSGAGATKLHLTFASGRNRVVISSGAIIADSLNDNGDVTTDNGECRATNAAKTTWECHFAAAVANNASVKIRHGIAPSNITAKTWLP